MPSSRRKAGDSFLFINRLFRNVGNLDCLVRSLHGERLAALEGLPEGRQQCFAYYPHAISSHEKPLALHAFFPMSLFFLTFIFCSNYRAKAYEELLTPKGGK